MWNFNKQLFLHKNFIHEKNLLFFFNDFGDAGNAGSIGY